MSPQIGNIIGLLSVMVGVILLFVFGMPYRIRSGGMGFLTLSQRDEADLKQEKLYDRLGWLGFALVIGGTICQIIGQF